jgi:hypothetical protein
VSAIFLNFALINNNIDKVVIGVDNLKQLKKSIDGLNFQDAVTEFYPSLLELKETDEDIILPTKWQN